MIRQATSHDIKALADIGLTTFLETYAHLNTPENMEKYLVGKFTEESIGLEMNETGTIFLVEEEHQALLSYAKMRVNLTEMPDPKAIELERFYVKKTAQGQKLGKKMIDACIEMAKNQDFNLFWLGVWEHNHKAIGFYEAMGFTQFGKHVFQLGDDAQTDFLMKKQI